VQPGRQTCGSCGQRVQICGVLCASLHALDVVRQPIAAGGAPAGLGYTARPDYACAPTSSMTSILAGSNARRPHTNRSGSPNRDRPTPARGTFLFAVRLRCWRRPATLVESGGEARGLCQFGHPRFRFAQSGLRSSIVPNARAGRIGQTRSALVAAVTPGGCANVRTRSAHRPTAT
jgi:hypothetical protein